MSVVQLPSVLETTVNSDPHTPCPCRVTIHPSCPHCSLLHTCHTAQSQKQNTGSCARHKAPCSVTISPSLVHHTNLKVHFPLPNTIVNSAHAALVSSSSHLPPHSPVPCMASLICHSDYVNVIAAAPLRSQVATGGLRSEIFITDVIVSDTSCLDGCTWGKMMGIRCCDTSCQ